MGGSLHDRVWDPLTGEFAREGGKPDEAASLATAERRRAGLQADADGGRGIHRRGDRFHRPQAEGRRRGSATSTRRACMCGRI